jgi:hypothetical protein
MITGDRAITLWKFITPTSPEKIGAVALAEVRF